ncbi:MAG: glycosyltransferase [Janthinobacterium lividum]
MSYDFLLASFGTSGNLNPLLTAARQLGQRGHRSRIIADPAMRDEVEAAGFEYVAWRRAPTGPEADPADVSDIRQWFRRAIFEPAHAYAADILDEVGRAPTDAILAIDILFGAALGAEAAGIPLAILSPHISLRPLPGIPPVMSGLLPPKTAEERSVIAAAGEGTVALFDHSLPILNRARARLGLRAMSTSMDVFDTADRVLLAISQAFDYPADWLPDNVRYIGPLLDEPSWSRTWVSPWRDASPAGLRPRVLVACSSGAQGQGELIQRVVDAMGGLDVEAVVTTGPNIRMEDLRVPGNVHLRRSAPHNVVMQEVDLLITQGGHGTVSRALVNGLPQLVLPMGRDQNDNASRIALHGAGLQLSPAASGAEIADAARLLLSDPSFKIRARRLGAAIEADMAACGVVDEMERLALIHRRGAMVPQPWRA